MLERHGSAIASAERAVSIAPDVAAAHLGHGDILYRIGNYAGAGRAYQRAVALAPDNADALNKLATIARSEGRRDDAEALLAQALASAPGHPYARLNQATLAIRRHHADEGRRLLESMLTTTRLPADVRTCAGNALAMIAERERLSAPVAASLEANDWGPIEAALRSMSSRDDVEPRAADALAHVVENALKEPPVDGLFAPGPAHATTGPRSRRTTPTATTPIRPRSREASGSSRASRHRRPRTTSTSSAAHASSRVAPPHRRTCVTASRTTPGCAGPMHAWSVIGRNCGRASSIRSPSLREATPTSPLRPPMRSPER
jgi:hypothetical protein